MISREICCADFARARRGIRLTLMRPVFMAPSPPPVLARKLSTFGSCRTMPETRCVAAAISWNDVPCAARRLIMRESLSWSGTKPFGTRPYMWPVATRTAPNTTIIASRWRRTTPRLQP